MQHLIALCSPTSLNAQESLQLLAIAVPDVTVLHEDGATIPKANSPGISNSVVSTKIPCPPNKLFFDKGHTPSTTDIKKQKAT